VNEAGQVAGNAYRYSATLDPLGGDSFFFNGTSAQRINPVGGDYEYTAPGGQYRDSNPWAINASGNVAGSSNRYTASGADLGTDIWYFNGTTTKRINPIGPGYEKTVAGGTYRDASFWQLNDAGDVVGTVSRFGAGGVDMGRAGFFFNEATDVTSLLEFSYRDDGLANTDFVMLLSDTGVVLGSYEKFSGSSSLGMRAFWWSDDAGFHDLGALAAGGLSAAGWAQLGKSSFQSGTFTGGSPLYIAGLGLPNDQTGGSAPFVLEAQLPEPAAAAALALLLFPARLLSRRRYKISR
jgi:hypothetical protein